MNGAKVQPKGVETLFTLLSTPCRVRPWAGQGYDWMRSLTSPLLQYQAQTGKLRPIVNNPG